MEPQEVRNIPGMMKMEMLTRRTSAQLLLMDKSLCSWEELAGL
jgi:hypothetical protein